MAAANPLKSTTFCLMVSFKMGRETVAQRQDLIPATASSLPEYVGYVELHGALRHKEPARDLLIGGSAYEEAEYFSFPDR